MMPPAFHALYLLYLKMRPFIQKARFVLPRRLYVPFSGRRLPRCSKTRILACCSRANWTMRALTRCAICSSTWRIFRQKSALSCSFSARMPVCERLRAIRPSSCAPCARYLCAFPDKGGSQDGAFNCLDAAHGYVLVEIEIDRANLGLRIAGDLLLDCGGSSERLFDGGMQPELLPLADQRRTAQIVALGGIARERVNLEPGPA